MYDMDSLENWILILQPARWEYREREKEGWKERHKLGRERDKVIDI